MIEIITAPQRCKIAKYPAGVLMVIRIGEEQDFRATVTDPKDAIANVWPIMRGQETNPERLTNLEAVSTLGSKVIEGEISPRVLPIESDEGPVEWGELIPGQELVFQNRRDGAGTMTYTGYPIAHILVEVED